MGGAVGEVHGAKLVGLLERARDEKPAAVLLLVESGGVRLHEANAGLIGVSEIMRAMLALRSAGVPVIVLDGGQFGCFGGMGIAARLCDAIVMSEEGPARPVRPGSDRDHLRRRGIRLARPRSGLAHGRRQASLSARRGRRAGRRRYRRLPQGRHRSAGYKTRPLARGVDARNMKGSARGWSGSAPAATRSTSGPRSASKRRKICRCSKPTHFRAAVAGKRA